MGSVKTSVPWNRASYVFQTTPFNWKIVDGKKILITGSTGLIGAHLTRVFLVAAKTLNLDIHLILPVRDKEKATRLFGDLSKNITLIKWDLDNPDFGDVGFDFAFHLASPTSSSYFKNHPVETIKQIINSSEALLSCAVKCNTKKVVFLSTMEVYGDTKNAAKETMLGSMDTMVVRNCYPEAKKLVECLCASYAEEFGIFCTVARLSQCFGEGVAQNDSRVFAEFARCVVSGKDIVLFSDGSKKNMYVSVDDAVAALLILLERGENKHTYNVANEETYCSVKEMAYLIKKTFDLKPFEVRFENNIGKEAIFRKSTDLRLDCSEIRKIGWNPSQNLLDMYFLMIAGWGFDPNCFRSLSHR